MNWAGIITITLLAGWLPSIGLFNVIIKWRRSRPERNAIDSSGYRAPAHVCSIDLVRSKISVEADGSILACCCLQGCGNKVRLMRNMHAAMLEAR